VVAASPKSGKQSGKRRRQSGRRGATPDRSSIVLAISISAAIASICRRTSMSRSNMAASMAWSSLRAWIAAAMPPSAERPGSRRDDGPNGYPAIKRGSYRISAPS